MTSQPSLKRPKRNREGGSVKFILLFLVFAATLWHFNVDVRGFFEKNPKIQEWGLFAWFLLQTMWTEHFLVWIMTAWEWVISAYEYIIALFRRD